ncbi:MAG: serine hydrolase [Chitinophagaceae bacterium]|nr:MAG: serine hydrolase [Chitinophagaceae bacterium]
MKFCFLFLYITFALLSAAIGQSPKQPNRIKAVENNLIPYVPVQGFPAWNIRERMKYYDIPGASIAVIKDYKIDWAKSYGLADTTKKTPVTNNTMFSAGSISKLVTAIIAMRLVERGKLSLDSPINNYLTSWKLKESDFTRKQPVTLRMLLSHTGGTSQSAYFGYLPTKTTLPTIVQILNGDSLAEVNPVVANSEGGKEFRYSGGGYMIVQMAIMDALKKDFALIADEEIFRPLAMRNSTFTQPLPPQFAKQAAWGYSTASWYKGMPYVYPQQAAAGLYSTPTDLALLLIELQKCYDGKGKLLNAATMKRLVGPVTTISKGAYLEQMGLGAFLLERSDNTSPQGKYFEHQGANAGFISFAIGSVQGGNGVVIMLNSGDDFNAFGTELRRSIARVYGWTNFLPPAIKPVKLSNEVLDSYVGRYRKGADEVLSLRREGSYLVEKINDSRDIYCFPIAKDTIVFTDYNVKGYFGRGVDGQIISLRNEYQSETQAMPKMKGNEFTPSEHLKAKRYIEAKEGFKGLNLNEYQITYLAYDWLNKKPMDAHAVKTLLDVAVEQHPRSSIVYSRWGDFYKAIGDRQAATKSYKKSLELEPGNKDVIESLRNL